MLVKGATGDRYYVYWPSANRYHSFEATDWRKLKHIFFTRKHATNVTTFLPGECKILPGEGQAVIMNTKLKLRQIEWKQMDVHRAKLIDKLVSNTKRAWGWQQWKDYISQWRLLCCTLCYNKWRCSRIDVSIKATKCEWLFTSIMKHWDCLKATLLGPVPLMIFRSSAKFDIFLKCFCLL